MNFTLPPDTEVRIVRAFDVTAMKLVVRADVAHVGVLYEPRGVESCKFTRNNTAKPVIVFIFNLPADIRRELQQILLVPLRKDETRGIFAYEDRKIA